MRVGGEGFGLSSLNTKSSPDSLMPAPVHLLFQNMSLCLPQSLLCTLTIRHYPLRWGLSDSLCPFLQICWHSPFIEVCPRKKGLPYVRQSLCKTLWTSGTKACRMRPTLSFIHSFPTKYLGPLLGTRWDAEIAKHYSSGTTMSQISDRQMWFSGSVLKCMLGEIKETFPQRSGIGVWVGGWLIWRGDLIPAPNQNFSSLQHQNQFLYWVLSLLSKAQLTSLEAAKMSRSCLSLCYM